MKLALILLLACNALALAAERPTGFLGIPWGASPEEVKRVLQKRPGVTFPENADDFHIEMTGGTFAGQPVAKWVIEFPERKFAMAAVTLKTEGSATGAYNEFLNQLVAKYGSSTTTSSSSSKKTGAGKTKTPQAPGKTAIWKFPPTMKEKSSVLISVELTGANPRGGEDTGGTVTIKYQNESLTPGGPAAGKDTPKTATPLKKEDL